MTRAISRRDRREGRSHARDLTRSARRFVDRRATPARRDAGGETGGCAKKRRGHSHGRQVSRREAEQQRAGGSHRESSRWHANQQSKRQQPQAVAEDQHHYLTSSRAKRQPDSDLLPATHDHVRDDAIQAKGHHHHREHAECSSQPRCRPFSGQAFANLRLQFRELHRD